MTITPPPFTRETRAARSSSRKSPGGVQTGPIGAVLSYAASNPRHVIRSVPHLHPSPRRQVGEVERLSLSAPSSSVLRFLRLCFSVVHTKRAPWSPSYSPFLCRLPRVVPPACSPARDDTSPDPTRFSEVERPRRTYRTLSIIRFAFLFPLFFRCLVGCWNVNRDIWSRGYYRAQPLSCHCALDTRAIKLLSRITSNNLWNISEEH